MPISSQSPAIVNMKYSIQYCLLDNDNLTAAATSCIDDCQPLKSVYDASWFTVPRPGQYDYCDINGGAFGTYADGCITCLQGVEGSVVLGNCTTCLPAKLHPQIFELIIMMLVMSTMQSACKDKPNSTDNDTINLPRKLFETATVASSQTAAASSSGTAIASASSLKGSTLTAAPTSSSTSSSQSSSSSQGSSSSGLSSGAAAGIGVGAGIVALAAIGGLTWYLLRRRRRRSAVTELRAISEKDTGVFTNPPQHLASTPLVEADGCYNSDGAKIKSGGAWRAELPST